MIKKAIGMSLAATARSCRGAAMKLASTGNRECLTASSLPGKPIQLPSGAVYTDDEGFTKIHKRKLDALEDHIESMNGKPLLITCWFRSKRTSISGLLSNLGASWKEISDEKTIREWNEGKPQKAPGIKEGDNETV